MPIGMDVMSVPWLKRLLAITSFFTACEVHTTETKNECNKFCLDCYDFALCGSCIESSHKDHQIIQIRRSSYNEAVRTTEIYKHVDILGIQTYVINNSTIVFLNKRAHSQPKRHNKIDKVDYYDDWICRVCERNLVNSTYFCSLACKLEYVQEAGGFFLSAKKMEEMERLLEESIKGSLEKEKAKKSRQQNSKRKIDEAEIDEAEIDEENEKDGDDEENEEKEDTKGNVRPINPFSKRKPNSRRKGIPHRAPFF